MSTPLQPTLYSKNGVYRGIHYFLIFALKHILLVLVRTVSRIIEAVLTCTHNICFEQKYKNSRQKNQLKIDIFTVVKNRCILHGRDFVMETLMYSVTATFLPQNSVNIPQVC